VAEGFENQYPATVSEENAPVMGNILSVMYGEKTSTLKLWEANRYLVSDLSENDLGYDLTLVPYNKIVYETTSIDDIPDYKSSILSPAPVVYEEQQRKELANQIEALREITRPENMNRIAKSVIAESTPRFRGVYYEIGYIDEEGRGVIGGDIMNLEDYVYYAGITGEWETMHIFQWTSFGWEMKARPSDDTSAGWMYMDAAASIGEGQPVGVFSDVFCQALTAHTAFIKNLYMQQGVVREGGTLRSEIFNNTKGWLIDSKGNATFNNGTFRGHVEGISANFAGNLNANVSLFGAGQFPLAGAVREYITFGYNNNTNLLEKSVGMQYISRLSTGKYELVLDYKYHGLGGEDFVKRLGVVGWACTSAFIGLGVLKNYGGTRINITIGSFTPYIALEIRTTSGILTDPYYASIMIIG
jgi:hypothetical protein